MDLCKCSGGYGNGGHPSCAELLSEGKRLFIGPRVDKDGNDIVINVGDNIDDAYIKNLLYRDEDHFMLTQPFENPSTERDDPITQSFDSGAVAQVDQGSRTYTLFFNGVEAGYKKDIDSFICQEPQILIVSKNGDLQGMTNDDCTTLRGIYAEKGSMFSKFIFASKGTPTVQGLEFTFQFETTEEDAFLMQIASEDITGINLLSTDGVLGVTLSEVSAPTTTEYNFKAVLSGYGTLKNKTPWIAAEDTDVNLFNQTQSANVALTGLTQNSDGDYTASYVAGVAATDILVLTVVSPSTTDKPFRGTNSLTSSAAV